MQANNNNNRKPVKFDVECRSTPAYAELMKKGAPENEAKRMHVALLRADFQDVQLPQLVRAVNMPTSGIIRNGLDAYVVNAFGARVRGDREIRDSQGMPRAADLVNLVAKRNNLNPLAWTPLGNVSQNLGCLAWTVDELVCCDGEISRLPSRKYRCLNIWNDGHVSIDDVQFAPGPKAGTWDPRIGEQSERKQLHLAVSGQPLVVGGQAIDHYQDMEAADGFADLRHLVVSAFVHVTDLTTRRPALDSAGRPIKRDFGLEQVLVNPKLRADAIAGQIVRLGFSLTDVNGERYTVTADELARALDEKGYIAVSSDQELNDHLNDRHRGFYRIDPAAEQLSILFARSPYPHHFVAIRPDERRVLYEGFVSGWSNNAGTNPSDLARDLARAGFSESILLDNGGDVVLVRRGTETSDGWADPNGTQAIVPSSLKREQWAALFLYHSRTPSDSAGLTMAVSNKGTVCGPCIKFQVEL